jgi:CW_7 repeat
MVVEKGVTMPRASRTSDPEPAEGQVPAGDYEPAPQPVSEIEETENKETENKSVEDVAKEVVAGHWGRGNKRKKKLEDAGYDVKAVDEEVSRIFKQ